MRHYLTGIVLSVFASPPIAALELHTPHCLYGCPDGAPHSNDIIVRDNYTMSSNDFTKFADWVAYKVTTNTVGSGCDRNWKADPALDEDETLEPDDYKDAHAVLKTDRGHQVPLASFCGTNTWQETNYLSNITPQKSDLNQGAWKNLEDKVRQMVNTGETVFVLTGPLYEQVMHSMPKADEFHVVPSAYWKVVAVKAGEDIQTTSFIFEQTASRGQNFCDFKVALEDVEKRAHLDLFPERRNSSLLEVMIPGLCSSDDG